MKNGVIKVTAKQEAKYPVSTFHYLVKKVDRISECELAVPTIQDYGKYPQS
jgi:hypothetical protein